MNHKKLLRLYHEENLRVRRRRGRKRVMGIRAPMTLPQGPNQGWSLDFLPAQDGPQEMSSRSISRDNFRIDLRKYLQIALGG